MKSGTNLNPAHNNVEALRAENEMLKAQLMNSSLINDLTKVLQSSTDVKGITQTLLLGIQEILSFDRVILFSIDVPNFCLRPQSWVGVKNKDLEHFTVPLGFEGGETTDSIFLNRHVLVDYEDSLFSKQLNSRSFLVIPIISKAIKKCWEYKSCTCRACPAHGSHNPYCWSIPGSGGHHEGLPENDRRRTCLQCACFRCEGVFWMDRTSHNRPISSDDITILTTIITHAGMILENFRIRGALETANAGLSSANEQLKQLNHELQLAQTKIQNDLDHARTVQQGLLPQDLSDTDRFSVATRYVPAQAVGGDYYDVFRLTPNLYGIIVADVSGHGVASALIMSMFKVLLKTNAAQCHSPQKTLELINQTFLTEIKTDNFVTIFYAVIDTEKRTICYTSAGHCPILILDKRSGEYRRINAEGLFLGVFPEMMLKETSHHYEYGRERLVLYTDGLTEAQNDKGEMFDLERLTTISQQTLRLSPEGAATEILKLHKKFCGGRTVFDDDITLLVIDI